MIELYCSFKASQAHELMSLLSRLSNVQQWLSGNSLQLTAEKTATLIVAASTSTWATWVPQWHLESEIPVCVLVNPCRWKTTPSSDLSFLRLFPLSFWPAWSRSCEASPVPTGGLISLLLQSPHSLPVLYRVHYFGPALSLQGLRVFLSRNLGSSISRAEPADGPSFLI